MNKIFFYISFFLFISCKGPTDLKPFAENHFEKNKEDLEKIVLKAEQIRNVNFDETDSLNYSKFTNLEETRITQFRIVGTEKIHGFFPIDSLNISELNIIHNLFTSCGISEMNDNPNGLVIYLSNSEFNGYQVQIFRTKDGAFFKPNNIFRIDDKWAYGLVKI